MSGRRKDTNHAVDRRVRCQWSVAALSALADQDFRARASRGPQAAGPPPSARVGPERPTAASPSGSVAGRGPAPSSSASARLQALSTGNQGNFSLKIIM